ncbi:sugar ABC transporter permease [Enemella dayhoffiae]|uniref:Sugar ABC transporter permease n=1 Tax=Enemella dayhoffiae TaxID=2016507 RepID=A0A255H146_9ACTN|nr:carbohydrate ABC transporter permease [Enemella dayhoffiae]OYO21371.1 sugar ABC transporter permease [Enemella dayhoffiae]
MSVSESTATGDGSTAVDEQSRSGGVRPNKRPRGSGGDRALTPITHVVLVVWTLVTALPVLWVFASSLKTDNEIFVDSWKLPKVLMWENYARAWGESGFKDYFLNSVIVVGCSVVLVMVLGSMVAYCLARYEFPGRKILLGLFVGANAVPMFVALVPLFAIMKRGIPLGPIQIPLLNTYHGLIAVYTAWALSFTVFFLTSFFRALPQEVYEAAFVDGAGHFKTFFLVMLPMARPGLISIGIFNALGLWNQYLIPLFLNPDPKHYVITQGLAKMAADTNYASDFSGLFAGLVIGMAPVLILYFIFQKQIQTGMTAGAVK